MTVDQAIARLRTFHPNALVLQGAKGMTVERWIKMLIQYEGHRDIYTNIGIEAEIETFPVVLVEGWKPRGLFGRKQDALMYGERGWL